MSWLKCVRVNCRVHHEIKETEPDISIDISKMWLNFANQVVLLLSKINLNVSSQSFKFDLGLITVRLFHECVFLFLISGMIQGTNVTDLLLVLDGICSFTDS